MQTACTVAGLSAMEQGLGEALATLCPGRGDLDVLCYNCTAGSFVIGEDKIVAMIETAQPQARATTLLSGVHAALRAVGARRIAMATAYTDDINRLEMDYFARQGIDVVSMAGLGLFTDVEMNRVSRESLMSFARHVDRPEADAVFISCGALRSTEVVEALERELGKPVIGSNQASMWNCLRLAGISDRMPEFGLLLREH